VKCSEEQKEDFIGNSEDVLYAAQQSQYYYHSSCCNRIAISCPIKFNILKLLKGFKRA